MFRSGVIGSPVAHSLSPRLHEAAFHYLGIEGTSQPFEVTPSDTESIYRATTLDAFSITTPMKEVMLSYCEPTPRALSIGAVNSIRRKDDGLEGDNFDGEGFHRAIVHQLDVDIRNEIACVYGSGPAARSIVESLLRHGAGGVEVIVRRDIPSHEVFSDARVKVSHQPSVTADLVVNATTVGLTGEAHNLPPAVVAEHTAYVDVAYFPSETAWMQEMRQSSNRVANGLQMLLWQAKLQIEWWFNTNLPIEIFLKAVES